MERFWNANKKYIAGAVTIVSVFIFVKYILALVLPFFLALCLLSLMRPLIQAVEEHMHIGRGILAGGILLFLLAASGIALWYLVSEVCAWIRCFAGNIDVYEKCLCDFVHTCCRGLEQRMGVDAGDMEAMIFRQVGQFGDDMKRKAFPFLMNQSVAYARMLCSAAGFFFMTFLATVLLAKDWRNICADFSRYRLFTEAAKIVREIGRLSGHFLKAQGIILCCISVICMLGLAAAGMKNSVLIGLFAGLMDALPFIGTGCVLVPIALWQLIQGKLWKSLWILLLYVICAVTREFLEPKLLGKRFGVYPVVILLAIYAGVKLYGLSGVIFGPLSLLLIREIWRRSPIFHEND